MLFQAVGCADKIHHPDMLRVQADGAAAVKADDMLPPVWKDRHKHKVRAYPDRGNIHRCLHRNTEPGTAEVQVQKQFQEKLQKELEE